MYIVRVEISGGTRGTGSAFSRIVKSVVKSTAKNKTKSSSRTVFPKQYKLLILSKSNSATTAEIGWRELARGRSC